MRRAEGGEVSLGLGLDSVTPSLGVSARTTPQVAAQFAGLLQKDSGIRQREREREFHKQLPDLSAQVSLHLVSQSRLLSQP